MIKILIIIFVFLIACVLTTLPTYFLWNWLMPTLFSIKTITLWQALGLNMLTSILFGRSKVTECDD